MIVGDEVVVTVPSLEGTRGIVERIHERVWRGQPSSPTCWIRLSVDHPQRGYAGALLAYASHELALVTTTGET